MARFYTVLSYGSWLGRHIGAFAACLLAFRFLFGAIAVAKERSRSEPAAGAASAVPTDRNPLDKLLNPKDLEEVQKLREAQEKAAQSGKEAGDGPKVRLRSIVIDFGPPRSEVLISGRSVGHTPYAGQVACRDGDKIRVDVVPRTGLPLSKTMLCPVAGSEAVHELE